MPCKRSASARAVRAGETRSRACRARRGALAGRAVAAARCATHPGAQGPPGEHQLLGARLLARTAARCGGLRVAAGTGGDASARLGAGSRGPTAAHAAAHGAARRAAPPARMAPPLAAGTRAATPRAPKGRSRRGASRGVAKTPPTWHLSALPRRRHGTPAPATRRAARQSRRPPGAGGLAARAHRCRQRQAGREACELLAVPPDALGALKLIVSQLLRRRLHLGARSTLPRPARHPRRAGARPASCALRSAAPGPPNARESGRRDRASCTRHAAGREPNARRMARRFSGAPLLKKSKPASERALRWRPATSRAAHTRALPAL